VSITPLSLLNARWRGPWSDGGSVVPFACGCSGECVGSGARTERFKVCALPLCPLDQVVKVHVWQARREAREVAQGRPQYFFALDTHGEDVKLYKPAQG
jgi:hypothetical protein